MVTNTEKIAELDDPYLVTDKGCKYSRSSSYTGKSGRGNPC